MEYCNAVTRPYRYMYVHVFAFELILSENWLAPVR
jgi:hypothetical protein